MILRPNRVLYGEIYDISVGLSSASAKILRLSVLMAASKLIRYGVCTFL